MVLVFLFLVAWCSGSALTMATFNFWSTAQVTLKDDVIM
jgi:hypothetical protein